MYSDFTSNTGIEVEFAQVPQADYIVKLTSLISADQSPDVLTENGDFPRTLKVLRPIDKETTGIDLSDSFWDQGVIKMYSVGGKPYIIESVKSCWNNSGAITYYHKTILEENGIKTPDELVKENNWNVDSFTQLLRQIKSSVSLSRPAASVAIDCWTSLYGAKQITWNPENSTFTNTVTDGKMKDSLRKLLELKDEGLVKIIDNHDDDITTGSCVVQICGAYGLRTSPGWFYTMDVDDLGFTYLPKVNKEDSDYPVVATGHAYGLVRGSRNPMGAGYYLRYYLNEDHVDMEAGFKNEEALAFYKELRAKTDYSTVTFNRGVRMILDASSSSGTMLQDVIGSTAGQLSVNLEKSNNIISGAVSEGNALIQEIIKRDE
ncbi:MAG: extracellular solute-binding protein [Acutalibacteraceae bacterium]|nr:extracellular solute-binding protein [Acutalibacteraceae bacterium]